MNNLYIQHKGKVVEAGSRFEHVMAIALDSRTGNTRGIIRCIVSRDGDVTKAGYIDRSALYKIKGDPLGTFEIIEELKIKNSEEIINKFKGSGGDFIGLEDPDIWVDEKTDLIHVYFTLPIRMAEIDIHGKHLWSVSLGHAIGKSIDSLEMTEPVLVGVPNRNAKEVSIAPINSKGFRYNLIESSDKRGGTTYSTVCVAIAHDMGKPWEFGEVVFHPADNSIPWIGGHASPGPLLPKSFIDLGEHRLLGVMNGREANQMTENGETKYGMFSIGLYVYDYEHGKIEWVSPEPFIQDSEAVTITFASQFVETGHGKGILYAHVDDSFVRAYTLDASQIQNVLRSFDVKII